MAINPWANFRQHNRDQSVFVVCVAAKGRIGEPLPRLWILLFTILLTLALSAFFSITEWGYKIPTGPYRYAGVSQEHADVLFYALSRPFRQIESSVWDVLPRVCGRLARL